MGRLPVRLRALLLALCLASACAAAEAAGSAGPGILGMMEAMPMCRLTS